MRLLSTAIILGLTGLSLGKIARRWDDLTEKHSWVETPRGWTYKSAAPADHTFDLKIGMKQNGMDDLIGHLMEISDPKHER